MPRRETSAVSVGTVRANEISSRVANLPAEARAIRIANEETYLAATALLKTCKSFKDEIKRIFDPIVKAAHEAHKTATEKRKEVEKPVLDAEAILRPALEKYAEELERKKAEADIAAARIQSEQAAALERGEEVEFVPAGRTPESPKVEGLSFRDDWDFEITSEADLPRAYLAPNVEKIRRHVKALGKEAVIPGVRVFSHKVSVQR